MVFVITSRNTDFCGKYRGLGVTEIHNLDGNFQIRNEKSGHAAFCLILPFSPKGSGTNLKGFNLLKKSLSLSCNEEVMRGLVVSYKLCIFSK